MLGRIHKVRHVLGGYCEAYLAIRRQHDSQAIADIQIAKLQRLVRYSFDHVKYYREVFGCQGIVPEQIESLSDLQRLPILTKKELRDQFWDFLPHDLPACRVTRTSGSTGVPVCIFSDWASRRLNWGAVIRFHRAAGIPFVGGPILTLLRTTQEQAPPPHWTVAQGLHRRFYLNPFVRSPENQAYSEALLKRLRNPILKGIPTGLEAFAQAIRDGIFPEIRPRVILAGGEILTSSVRQLVETTFSAKIIDVYACNEARDIAWQCREAGGYHINADNVIVEILKDDRPTRAGEIGEVTITDLNRYVMPIIRYKNGDLARFAGERCRCGSQLPMIAEIIGRTGENVILPDGRVVLWNHLKSQMTHPHVRQFQIVQEAGGGLVVMLVPEKDSDTRALDRLLYRRFESLVGSAIPVTIEHVTDIPMEPSGKRTLVVSRYAP